MAKKKNKSKNNQHNISQKSEVDKKNQIKLDSQEHNNQNKDEEKQEKTQKTKNEIIKLENLNDEKESTALTVKDNSDNKAERTKYSKKAILLLSVIVLAIIFIIYSINVLGLFVKRSSEYEVPLLYVSEGKVKFINSKNKKPITVGNYEQSSDFDAIEHSNKNDKFILYSLDNNLFLTDTRSKKESTSIASNVESFQFSEGDKYILYIDTNGTLYSYDHKNINQLDTNVTLIVDVTKDRVFYKKDGNLYSKSLKHLSEEKTKIATEYEEATLNNSRTKILYSKELEDETYEYHVFNLKNKKDEKVLDNIYLLYDYSDDFTEFIYSTVNEKNTINLADYLNDDKKDSDANFKTYSFEDYWTGKVDYNTYKNNGKEANLVEKRNNLRTQLEDEKNKTYDLSTSIDVYYQKKEKQVKLAEKAKKVISVDMKDKRLIYTKEDYSSIEKINISDVSNLNDIKNHLKSNLKNTVKYSAKDVEAIEITRDKKAVLATIFKDEFYCEADGEIFYSKISKNKPVEVKTLATNAEVVDWENKYKDSLIILADIDDAKGTLKYIKSEKLVDLEKEVYEKNVIVTYNKVYYFKDYKNNKGDYYEYYNNKAKRIMNGVSKVYNIKEDYMYVLKDYSSKNATYDLYRYKNKKLEIIDYDVKDTNLIKTYD